jgi:hypothetical protein
MRRSPRIASGLRRKGSCNLISPSTVRSVPPPEGRRRRVPVLISIREMAPLVGTLLKVISFLVRSLVDCSTKANHSGGTCLGPTEGMTGRGL